MKIRSITCFADMDATRTKEIVGEASRFLQQARETFTDGGVEVQTVRLALPPLARHMPLKTSEAVARARELQSHCQEQGIDYVTVGAALIDDPPEAMEIIPDLIAATSILFAAGEIGRPGQGIDIPAIRACASLIARCAPLEENGFGNLRFTALANVPGGVPFLPAAYHSGGPSHFALAMEAADLAVDAFTAGSNLSEATAELTSLIEKQATSLQEIAGSLSERHGIAFTGFDFSLAPFPSSDRSLGAAMEALGLPQVGAGASVTAAAILTQCIDAARFQRTGFSGLFLPVLEDDRLALRAAEGKLELNDLLLCSAVCGTGLDTVPLPGNITEEEIASILLDVATLALRLDKPLTARLMPMPGKSAGDRLKFDFPFFAPGAVMAHKGQAIGGLLGSAGRIDIHPRRKTS